MLLSFAGLCGFKNLFRPALCQICSLVQRDIWNKVLRTKSMKIVVFNVSFLQRCIHFSVLDLRGVFGGQKMKSLRSQSSFLAVN